MSPRIVLVTFGFLCLDGCTAAPTAPGAGDDKPQGGAVQASPDTAKPVDPLEDMSYRRAESRGSTYLVIWRPLSGSIPKNEHFELEVRVYKKSGNEYDPLPGCRLAFSGWMPDHGHGMIRRPAAVEEAEGKYRVRGMLFHMGGHWQFFIDVIEGAHSERAEFDILL
jgi:hypothetical protein